MSGGVSAVVCGAAVAEDWDEVCCASGLSEGEWEELGWCHTGDLCKKARKNSERAAKMLQCALQNITCLWTTCLFTVLYCQAVMLNVC